MASENFQTENTSMKGSQTELDQVESTEADQKITAVDETPQIENLHSNSRIVTDLNCASDTVKAQTITNIKHSVTPKDRTQNNETNKSETEHKIISLYKNDRKRKEAISQDSGTRKQKLLKEDDHCKSEHKEQFFLEFVLTLEARCDDISMLSRIFLQMEWVNGSNRNCMYQLFQYFQNLFSS